MTLALTRPRIALICCLSSLSALIASAGVPSRAATSSPGCPRAEEFAGTALDPVAWEVFHGAPQVHDGRLFLVATATERADIQSTPPVCRYGTLTARLSSGDLADNGTPTDSSSGFEIFAPGGCHYSVQMVHNGHLGVLRSLPDADGVCHGDPELQAFVPVTHWDVLRRSQALSVTIQWGPGAARLVVSDGSNMGVASYSGAAVPAVAMRIRLNQDFGRRSSYDYVRGSYGS